MGLLKMGTIYSNYSAARRIAASGKYLRQVLRCLDTINLVRQEIEGPSAIIKTTASEP